MAMIENNKIEISFINIDESITTSEYDYRSYTQNNQIELAKWMVENHPHD